MKALTETEREELQTACAEAERLAAEGKFSAGQSLLVSRLAERLRAENANQPHGAALIDAWVQALRYFVNEHGTPSVNLNELD